MPIRRRQRQQRRQGPVWTFQSHWRRRWCWSSLCASWGRWQRCRDRTAGTSRSADCIRGRRRWCRRSRTVTVGGFACRTRAGSCCSTWSVAAGRFGVVSWRTCLGRRGRSGEATMMARECVWWAGSWGLWCFGFGVGSGNTPDTAQRISTGAVDGFDRHLRC
ncbi:hypothetical protein IWX47DRAFT_874025 [Phyllosticta citricarpa]